LYSSATFWTGIGTAAAVLTLLTTVVLWSKGAPRRLLIYGLRSQIALLSSDAVGRAGIGSELQVIVNGRALTNPHVVSIAVVNRSRRDIRSTDFEDGIPLAIELNVPILQVLSSDTGGAAMPKMQLDTDDTKILIRPGLIRRRQVISLELLTDGAASLSCCNPALADVTVRDGTDDDVEPRWLLRMIYVSVIPILTYGIIQESPTLSARHDWVELSNIALWIGASILLIPVIAYMMVMAYREGGLSRERPWARPDQ
jgi:hypothetical protein